MEEITKTKPQTISPLKKKWHKVKVMKKKVIFKFFSENSIKIKNMIRFFKFSYFLNLQKKKKKF